MDTCYFTFEYREGTGVEASLIAAAKLYGGRIFNYGFDPRPWVEAEFSNPDDAVRSLRRMIEADQHAWVELYGYDDEWQGFKRAEASASAADLLHTAVESYQVET